MESPSWESADSGSEDRSSPRIHPIKDKSHIRCTTVTCNNLNGNKFEYSGWIYHLGINSIGHEYCHYRFLLIHGNSIELFKHDPHETPGIKPIRKGVIGHTLMVEDLGRREVNHSELYVIRLYNCLDHTRKGEIGCTAAADARKWIEAFEYAKQQGKYELTKSGSIREKLNMELDEINLDAHRPRVQRYAHSLRWLVRRLEEQGSLSRKSMNIQHDNRLDVYFDAEGGDVVEEHEWKCVRTINGVRIFEDVALSKASKGVLVKAVGVVDASADTIFDILLSSDRAKRNEWDTLTSDIELLDSVNGHFDVVYGTCDTRYLTWRKTKRHFVFARQWFRGQDGTYTILQFPSVHKKRPSRSGYKRIIINPSSWELRNLSSTSSSKTPRCLVTHTLEINHRGWHKWRNNPNFERTIPYALLSQVSGIKEYIEANPTLTFESSTTSAHSRASDLPGSPSELEDAEKAEEFYDAIAAADSSSDYDDSDSDDEVTEETKIEPQSVSQSETTSPKAETSVSQVGLAPESNNEFDSDVLPTNLDLSQFHGSLMKATNEDDKNCWLSPDTSAFMIRGKTYLKDGTKIKGGDSLLNLIAVDWFKVEGCLSNVALHPRCLVQSDQGKSVPFILVVNLQIPSRPNYSLVLYYAANRPVRPESLLRKFIDGSDSFRDSRLKLIPSIIEGYWMVKRAVGTKACMLGKAIKCKYLRQDNFLEIDVNIGSSSVAKSVIGLVLGYVTSLVVDLALVIEAKEEDELPEHILGAARLNRVQLDTAEELEL